MIEWDTVVVNAFLSLTVAVGVGLYIRYRVKPKHEEVFEHNRNEEIIGIFNTIDLLDFHFQNFLDDLETEMGPLTDDRETLSPRPKFEEMPDGGQMAVFSKEQSEMMHKFDNIKPKLKYSYEQIKKISEGFQKDYLRLLNHIESSFLRNVWLYFFDTTYYAEWAQKNYLMKNLLEKNMESAKGIIEFLEDDKTIDLSQSKIKKFIDKWKEKF